MGQDKALLEFHGLPQIEHAAGLLKSHCHQVYLSKRSDQKPYKDLGVINDLPEFAGRGPLSGILSAMKTFPKADWLVVACDLPLITDKTLKVLMINRDPQQIATAFISAQDGLPEPLCAVWEGHGYGRIMELFNTGIHCPRKILIKSNARMIPQDDPHWLDNVNTPQDYQEIKKCI